MEKEMSVAPQERMFILISWFWIARSIYLAAQLGIADRLTMPLKRLRFAAETETDPWSLYRLMRDLASVDIFTEVSDQCFALTAGGGFRWCSWFHAVRSDRGLRPLFRLDQRIEQFNGWAYLWCNNRNVSFWSCWCWGGRERTEEEYWSLLRANGFELTRVIPTHSLCSILEAVKL